MSKNTRFENLEVWKKSIALCKMVYPLTAHLPSDEKFGLISQMRRCAVSVPSNIAEGSSRDSDKDYIRFLNISLGSAAELKTQLIISKELGFLSPDKIQQPTDQLNEVSRMLYALKRSLNTANNQRPTIKD